MLTRIEFWFRRLLRLLSRSDWLGHPDYREPVIMCGDFN